MIDFLFALGQFICVIGLIYGALLAAGSVDWLDDLPADSFRCDPLTGHDTGSSGRAAIEQRQAVDKRLHAL